MKRLFLIAAIACFGIVSAQAQQGGNRQMMQQRMKQMLKDSLQLTDVQIDSVTAIQQAYQPQMREIFMDQSLSRDEKMAKMMPFRDSIKARLTPILTPDQLTKLDAMEQNMRRRMPQGGGK